MAETPQNGILKDAGEESKISRIRSECSGNKIGYRFLILKSNILKLCYFLSANRELL